jgi:hypothetical protein
MRADNVDLGDGQNFSGMIGKSKVSMKLWRRSPVQLANQGFLFLGSPPSKVNLVEGFYFYERYKRDILLVGQSDEQGNCTIWEYAEAGGPATGVFRGSLAGGRFRGQWESPDGKRSVEFDVLATRTEFRTRQEAATVSRQNEELATESVKNEDFGKAVFYLRMSRLAGMPSLTQNWEVLFETLAEGKGDGLRTKLTSCKKKRDWSCAFARGPLAFLGQQDGDLITAKTLYRELCLESDPSLSSPRAFPCLMYASLGERSGDRQAALAGYDFACQHAQSMCAKAWGPDEAELISAIREKRSDAVDRLLEKSINVNAQNGAALLQAVLWGNLKLVQALVQKGADPNLDDGQILDTAIMRDREDIASFLLDHGADPNGSFMGVPQALHFAVERGNIRLVEKLIAKRTDVNANDYVGAGTALILACEANQLEIVKLLLAHGADPTMKAKFHDPPVEATSNPEIKKMLNEAIASCRRGERKCEEEN